MVYLGDLPTYIDSERAQNSHTMLENLRGLQIGIPILYLPGNNDSLEGDYHSFTNGSDGSVLKQDKDASNPWPVINANSSSVKVSGLDFDSEFGFQSVNIQDGTNTLKVIALNTVIFSAKKEKYDHGEKNILLKIVKRMQIIIYLHYIQDKYNFRTKILSVGSIFGHFLPFY